MQPPQPALAERHHLGRRIGKRFEQRRVVFIDADIGRLRRQHDGDEQRERVDVDLELGARDGLAFGEQRA